ncbi:MAG: thioredoxin family protein [Thermodesulfobacteriota bacterium]
MPPERLPSHERAGREKGSFASGTILRHAGRRLIIGLAMCVLVGASLLAAAGGEVRASEKTGSGKVGLVFFGAGGCPSCAHVKHLLSALSSQYPLHIKTFDTDKPEDNALLDRLERIHARNGFSVPLVLVGESILMGEGEITEKLEPIVRDLSTSGGSSFPYLGPKGKAKRLPRKQVQSRCACESGPGRPPTIGEELDKLRAFLRRFY